MYNENEIRALIHKGEDSTTQFKENITNALSLAQEMVAFSNTQGGKIIIGVNDKSTILGLSSDDVSRLNQLISNCARANVAPPINPLTKIVTLDEKRILIVTITEGINKPYATNEGVYYAKVGADKRKISQEELLRLFQESHKLYADETIIRQSHIEDIDQALFTIFFKKRYKKELTKALVPFERIIENLNLFREGSLTLAGLLLFGIHPEKYRPALDVKCVSFLGNDASSLEYRDKENFEGTLSKLYEGSIAFLVRNLRKIQKGKSFNTQGVLEIPEATLEELVTNALVHRNYFIDAPIKIFIFDSRIEIINPGKLPNNLSIENIKSGISVARNPIIHSIAPYFLPYSGLGTGISRALQKYKAIEFTNDTEVDRFIVTIKRP